ncbi:MAG: Spy/CpxP family protein refolding chaperone [Campylobacterales bacterium]
MKKLVVSLVAISVLSVGAFASSCGGKKGGMMMDNSIMFSGIELSQKQQDAMFDLKLDVIEKEYEMDKKMKDKRGMSQYIKGEKFDKNSFIKDRSQMSEGKIALKAEKFEKMYNILTPVQKTQFAKNLDSMSKSCGMKKHKKGCGDSGKSGKCSDGRG